MKKLPQYLLIAIACWLVVAAASSLLGAQDISLHRAVFDASSVDHAVLFSVRMPRMLMASVAGAGLAAVGVVFQALLRNPLAEPYILGVSGGAALGATVVIAIGLPVAASWMTAMVPAAAMLGGVGATALVYLIVRSAPNDQATSMLLAGVIVNAIASSLITFIKTLVSASKAQDLLFWLMGFIDVPSRSTLIFVSLYVGIGCAVLFADAGRLNLLALGDEPAQHLGVNVKALQKRVFLAASLVVGAIVSVTGLIGFVGLVVPHALRKVVGADHRVLLPLSMLTGAIALSACELLARLSFRFVGTEPPIGAITALIGGPLFLILLARRVQW